jgi:predicted Rossmann fold nucleotide-binding protein DprA/Smf involved in DNA uptake
MDKAAKAERFAKWQQEALSILADGPLTKDEIGERASFQGGLLIEVLKALQSSGKIQLQDGKWTKSAAASAN